MNESPKIKVWFKVRYGKNNSKEFVGDTTEFQLRLLLDRSKNGYGYTKIIEYKLL